MFVGRRPSRGRLRNVLLSASGASFQRILWTQNATIKPGNRQTSESQMFHQIYLNQRNPSLFPIFPQFLAPFCLFSYQRTHLCHSDSGLDAPVLRFSPNNAQHAYICITTRSMTESVTRDGPDRGGVCACVQLPSVFALYFHTIQPLCSFHQSTYWLL